MCNLCLSYCAHVDSLLQLWHMLRMCWLLCAYCWPVCLPILACCKCDICCLLVANGVLFLFFARLFCIAFAYVVPAEIVWSILHMFVNAYIYVAYLSPIIYILFACWKDNVFCVLAAYTLHISLHIFCILFTYFLYSACTCLSVEVLHVL